MRVVVAVVTGVLLGGCAATVYEGKYQFNEGWRAAKVVEVLSASEMERPRFYDCVRDSSAEQLASTKFAVVKYRNMSRTQRRAVPLAPGQAFLAGETVYVQVGRCDVPLVRRTSAPKGVIGVRVGSDRRTGDGVRRFQAAQLGEVSRPG